MAGHDSTQRLEISPDRLKWPSMEISRDAESHEQLARIARAKASDTTDPALAVRLKETAVKHEMMARRMRRLAAKQTPRN